jgi:hypothetical protein
LIIANLLYCIVPYILSTSLWQKCPLLREEKGTGEGENKWRNSYPKMEKLTPWLFSMHIYFLFQILSELERERTKKKEGFIEEGSWLIYNRKDVHSRIKRIIPYPLGGKIHPVKRRETIVLKDKGETIVEAVARYLIARSGPVEKQRTQEQKTKRKRACSILIFFVQFRIKIPFIPLSLSSATIFCFFIYCFLICGLMPSR